MDSLFATILEKVRDEIVGLDLAGIPDTRVLTLSLPRVSEQIAKLLPCVVIAPAPGAETITAATNLSDDVGYGVIVGLVDGADNTPKDMADLDARLFWRERIVDRFIHNRLAGVTGLYEQRVEPAAVVDAAAWGQNLFVSAFVIRFVVRKRRRVA